MSQIPFEIYLEKRLVQAHLSCFVITHCATYSNIPLLSCGDAVSLSPCAGSESAAQAKQNLLTPVIKPTGPVPWAVGEEEKQGLRALIPVFNAKLLLGDSWEVTPAITTVASGSVTPF